MMQEAHTRAMPLRSSRPALDFVRYHSPFGSVEWLERHVAERRLRADQRIYDREREAGELTARQLEHGPPRIEEANSGRIALRTTTESR
jgi:hypothetical protein